MTITEKREAVETLEHVLNELHFVAEYLYCYANSPALAKRADTVFKKTLNLKWDIHDKV